MKSRWLERWRTHYQKYLYHHNGPIVSYLWATMAMLRLKRPLLALLLLLLTAIPAHAMLITEWTAEPVFMGQQVGTPTDPTQVLNIFFMKHRELVYDITEFGATLVSSKEISWEEYSGHMPGGPPAATPEPLTLGLLGGTLAVVGWVARRRGKK